MQTILETSRADASPTCDILAELVESCHDAERNYRRAAAELTEPVFRPLLLSYADQRAQFALMLETVLCRLGRSPRTLPNVPNVTGALHRGWLTVRAFLAPDTDRGVLEVCWRAEELAHRMYATALRARLPIDIRGMVEQQATNVREAQERLKSLSSLA